MVNLTALIFLASSCDKTLIVGTGRTGSTTEKYPGTYTYGSMFNGHPVYYQHFGTGVMYKSSFITTNGFQASPHWFISDGIDNHKGMDDYYSVIGGKTLCPTTDNGNIWWRVPNGGPYRKHANAYTSSIFPIETIDTINLPTWRQGKQHCFDMCGKTGGPCNWCGAGGLCCGSIATRCPSAALDFIAGLANPGHFKCVHPGK